MFIIVDGSTGKVASFYEMLVAEGKAMRVEILADYLQRSGWLDGMRRVIEENKDAVEAASVPTHRGGLEELECTPVAATPAESPQRGVTVSWKDSRALRDAAARAALPCTLVHLHDDACSILDALSGARAARENSEVEEFMRKWMYHIVDEFHYGGGAGARGGHQGDFCFWHCCPHSVHNGNAAAAATVRQESAEQVFAIFHRLAKTLNNLRLPYYRWLTQEFFEHYNKLKDASWHSSVLNGAVRASARARGVREAKN
jgi:hypothetical protein